VTIRELRLRANITQEMLAFESGIDRGYMGGLERASHSPTLETVYKVLPSLQVNFMEFAEVFDKNLRSRKVRGNQSIF
jgi:transcriptional regulator with XRE-family HTH domain